MLWLLGGGAWRNILVLDVGAELGAVGAVDAVPLLRTGGTVDGHVIMLKC